MKKDTVYSLRLNSKVREALKKAAEVKCRTMASLLDKILTDYLRDEGFLTRMQLGEERRRFKREGVPLPSRVIFKTNGKTESIPSVVKDISIGGVKVVFPKYVEKKITISSKMPHFELLVDFPRDNQQLSFECDMRHINKIESEIQIGAAFENMNKQKVQQLTDYLH